MVRGCCTNCPRTAGQKLSLGGGQRGDHCNMQGRGTRSCTETAGQSRFEKYGGETQLSVLMRGR